MPAIVLAVVLVRSSARTDPPREPVAGQVPTGSSPASPALDSCLIGLWEIVEYRTTFDVGSVEVRVSLRPGSVNRIRYGINGKASRVEPLSSFPDAVHYSCVGDRLEHRGDDYTRRFRRITRE